MGCNELGYIIKGITSLPGYYGGWFYFSVDHWFLNKVDFRLVYTGSFDLGQNLVFRVVLRDAHGGGFDTCTNTLEILQFNFN
jgi:hypothetical protein